MKKLVQTILVFAIVCALLAGCANTSTAPQASTASPASSSAATTAEQTAQPTAAQSGGAVSVEIMTQPWVGTPLGDNDPYKKYLDEHFHATFTLTQSADFANQILVRFASGNPPDLFDCDNNMLNKLYSQGVVVSDWTPYLDKMPTVFKDMGDLAKKYFTQNGKLICTSTVPGDQDWSFNIRTDWLKKLGLSQPKTMDDLIKIGKAFTFNDPDGNGKADTYGFTSAGGGTSLGEISNLQTMFGPINFYVAADGTVQHPIIDGNELAFLKFLKQLVDEKLIDPNWYTQGWNDRKPNLYKGMYGIVWYPPMALLTETDDARANDSAVVGWYDAMTLPKATATGGKLPGLTPLGTIRTCSAAAEKDAAKWNVILQFLEDTAWPNDSYFQVRWGATADGYTLTKIEDGYYYVNLNSNQGTHVRGGSGGNTKSVMGLWDWGKIINTYGDMVITGTTDKPSDLVTKTIAMQKDIAAIGRYAPDGFMLNLDPDVLTAANQIKNEFEINYILGKDTDYAAFQARWLAGGGQSLLDQAKQQFTALGMMK